MPPLPSPHLAFDQNSFSSRACLPVLTASRLPRPASHRPTAPQTSMPRPARSGSPPFRTSRGSSSSQTPLLRLRPQASCTLQASASAAELVVVIHMLEPSSRSAFAPTSYRRIPLLPFSSLLLTSSTPSSRRHSKQSLDTIHSPPSLHLWRGTDALRTAFLFLELPRWQVNCISDYDTRLPILRVHLGHYAYGLGSDPDVSPAASRIHPERVASQCLTAVSPPRTETITINNSPHPVQAPDLGSTFPVTDASSRAKRESSFSPQMDRVSPHRVIHIRLPTPLTLPRGKSLNTLTCFPRTRALLPPLRVFSHRVSGTLSCAFPMARSASRPLFLRLRCVGRGVSTPAMDLRVGSTNDGRR
ncbi:hypothetical protein EW146_g1898 [Bondarzewia mesenterica]|uniref:Uncharacterized protein n=1 Tax=Bondarzewia mesenterica TaxID=1095465 RepID=A0A4V3XFY6_9AGAM|nr:hypothetical protein EW146_g1898 [Bondarzewia mesenterica]